MQFYWRLLLLQTGRGITPRLRAAPGVPAVQSCTPHAPFDSHVSGAATTQLPCGGVGVGGLPVGLTIVFASGPSPVPSGHGTPTVRIASVIAALQGTGKQNGRLAGQMSPMWGTVMKAHLCA